MPTGYSLVGASVQDDGTNVGFGAILNFTGAGVTATVSGNVATIDIPGGGGGGGGWTDGGTAVYLTTATDTVSVGNNTPVPSRKFSVYNTGTDFGISVVTLANTNNVISTFVSGEANLRYGVDGGGITSWGAGGASAPDLRIRRSGTSTLTVDNGSTGSVAVNPGGDANSSIGSASLRWNSVTANAFLVFGAAGAANATASLGNQALRMGPGGGVALDVKIARTTGSTLTIDDNAAGPAVLKVVGRTETEARAVGVTTQTGAYAVASNVEVVLVNSTNGAFDVTLPNANLIIGRQITVKRINTSANAVTVKAAGGSIDGVAAATGIVLAGGTLNSLTAVSDGANWWLT